MTRQDLAPSRELGVPVRAVFHCILHPGADPNGQASLLASMGQMAGGFLVLDIDLNYNRCIQHEARNPKAFEPSASFRSPRSGALYCGSCYTGWLHRFIPGSAAIEDLGPVDEELATFPCRIDEAPDGSIFIGSYPGCCLSRYDPSDHTWTRFGRMDDTDMYFYPLCGVDGTVAGLVKMCKPHVVAFNPKTGERRTVGPVIDTQSQSGAIDLFKGCDGLLYIRSTEGNLRIQGLAVTAVEQLPEPAQRPQLPDGSAVEFADAASFQHRQLRVTPPPTTKAQPRLIDLNLQGKGTDLFLLHLGPDQRLYGSSILPEHLFSCRLDGSDMVDHGQCSLAGGEAYSMASFQGKLYIASYPGARLSIYDPTRPYRFGEDEQANPRDIGRPDQVAYRPRAMLAGPAEKVWIGSFPDYGMWGGTLVSYDPATQQFHSHRHLIRDCSVASLAWLENQQRILVGLSISGGTGTQPRAREAGFVFWNPHTNRSEGTDTFGLEGVSSVIDLRPLRDTTHPQLVYAVVLFNPPAASQSHSTTAELLLLDVDQRMVVDRSPLGEESGWPLEISLHPGPDRAIYGFTKLGFYRINPGSARLRFFWKTPLDKPDDYVSVPGPIVGRTAYFASQHRLRCLEIPQWVGE